ncbi:MAG: universal stress protein [Balneolaceae bacterium]|nr:universal stress protein [Balneolaceae bacterium]MBO6546803.1 universal stress protein [Balneolaceae bacterium]MBO6649163.1 universal stress protein [Balneolaceae bacterium]
MKVNHILVPTDFSERSEVAIKMAGELVDLYGCTVDLIHIIPMMKYFSESMDPLGVPFSIEKHLYPQCLENSHEKLEQLAQKYIKKEYRGKLFSEIDRKPSEAITKLANKGEYDLVLMSARGEHNSIHVMGSTTEKVIRYSKIPVLSINEEMEIENLNKIIVPVDFSESSFFAVIPAFELAKETDSKIELVNVVELYSAGNDMIPYVPTSIEEQPLYESMITKLTDYLLNHSQYELHLKRTGVPFEDVLVSTEEPHTISIDVRSTIIKGITAYHEIAEYANDHADMVVMTTHGRTGLSRVFMGSTTEHVSRLIERPLLIVRPQFYEEEVERN